MKAYRTLWKQYTKSLTAVCSLLPIPDYRQIHHDDGAITYPASRMGRAGCKSPSDGQIGFMGA